MKKGKRKGISRQMVHSDLRINLNRINLNHTHKFDFLLIDAVRKQDAVRSFLSNHKSFLEVKVPFLEVNDQAKTREDEEKGKGNM
jgi:hypothetical protein